MIGGDSIEKYEKEIIQSSLDNEKAVLKRLEKLYKDTIEEINERIALLLGRQDANLPNVIHRVEYQKMLREQLQAIFDKLHANEFETINEYLQESYDDAFVAAVYTMHQQDIPLILPIDHEAAVKAITVDTKLKESLYQSLGIDVTRLKKTVQSEITRGVVSGLLYAEIARNIANVSGAPMRRAQTIARTEAGRIQEQAHMKAGYEAKAYGADVLKEWCSVLDGETRPSHQQVDGEIKELDERFSNGLLYPKESGGKAEEVINCRCTTLIRRRGSLDADELKVLKQRAEYFGLDKSDSFKEFKKKYMKTAQTVENTGKSGIIKVDKVVSGHESTPKKSAANTVIDHLGKAGVVNVRSFYGDDGMKVKDLHTDDHGYPKQHPYGDHGEHAHDYEWDEAGRLKNKTTREITKEEKERSGDIFHD